MELYSHGASCSKCGQKDINTIYIKKGEALYSGFSAIPKIADSPTMKRICNNCGHTWLERPMDDATALELAKLSEQQQ